jgi:ABC-type multidrug transport system ATPase subunit
VAGGTSVLLTTQYLNEADHLANLITVVDHARVVASGPPDQLKAPKPLRRLYARYGIREAGEVPAEVSPATQLSSSAAAP